jgi:Uma2 family endonuclease
MNARLRPPLYEQLAALPDVLTGEIIDGQLYTQPRPRGPHGWSEVVLGAKLIDPYGFGRGGPGGWWILVEPEVHLVRDTEVVVPDLTGWRKSRMPRIPEGHRFEVVPDWVCEILSPASESKDRRIKLPLYARHGVAYAWLIDPEARSLEAYELAGGEWRPLGTFRGSQTVAVAPFDAVPLALAELWVG